jgi:tripartite-type tricarboxylate transporter receptor subunit TctC
MRGQWQALCGAVAAAAAILAGGSWAQTFPGKPVRYVIPFDAGSSPDIVGRTIAERLSRLWGQQVVVDNRVGAAGTLGSAYVAKSPPDAYTLLQANIASNAIAVSLYAKMPYDQLRDFAPITRIGMTPNVIMVHPSVPFRTVRQLVDYARAHPGKLSYSASLPGTSPHLTIELLKLQLKFDVLYIPYKLGAQAVTDTIGGQVPINISNAPLSMGAVQSGRLRALAVTSLQRVLGAAGRADDEGIRRAQFRSELLVRADGPRGYADGDSRQDQRRHARRVARAGGREAHARCGDAAVADDATGVRSVRARRSRSLGPRYQGGGYPAAVTKPLLG